jgi:hypothetical protein
MILNGQDGNHVHSRRKNFGKVHEHFESKIKSEEVTKIQVTTATADLIRTALRNSTLSGTRFDKRARIKSDLGSRSRCLTLYPWFALFQRGMTQAITILPSVLLPTNNI